MFQQVGSSISPCTLTYWRIELLTLEEVKEILGIIGPVQDSNIESLIPVVTGWIEGACNRGLEFKAETHDSFSDIGNTVYLYRFPIVTVYSVTVNGQNALSNYDIDTKRGVLVSRSHLNCAYNKLSIVYDGGFQPVPADLALAFASIIGDQIGVVPPSTSSSSGGGSGTAPLKSLTLGSGALGVSFQSSSSSSSSGGITGGYDVSVYPTQLQAYAGTLDKYRTEGLPL